MLIRFKGQVVNLANVCVIKTVEVTRGNKKPSVFALVFTPTSFQCEYSTKELALDAMDLVFERYAAGDKAVRLPEE